MQFAENCSSKNNEEYPKQYRWADLAGERPGDFFFGLK
jgi:hypothetical protein